jgi:hypothetical protein
MELEERIHAAEAADRRNHKGSLRRMWKKYRLSFAMRFGHRACGSPAGDDGAEVRPGEYVNGRVKKIDGDIQRSAIRSERLELLRRGVLKERRS